MLRWIIYYPQELNLSDPSQTVASYWAYYSDDQVTTPDQVTTWKSYNPDHWFSPVPFESTITVYDSTIEHQTAADKAAVKYVAENGWDLADSDTLILGEPSTVTISQEEFEKIDGNQLTFAKTAGNVHKFTDFDSLSDAGLLVINNKRLAINENFGGHYVGIADNTNGNGAWDHDCVLDIKSKNKNSSTNYIHGNEYVSLNDTNRLSRPLSAYGKSNANIIAGKAHQAGSVSEEIEGFQGGLFESEWSDILSIFTYKVRQSIYDVNKLDVNQTGAAIGSLSQYKTKGSTSGGDESYFIETKSQNNLAPYAKVLVNDNIHQQSWYDNKKQPTTRVRVYTNNYTGNLASADSEAFVDGTEQASLSSWVGAMGTVTELDDFTHAENLYANGTFKENSHTGGNIGSIPKKLDRVFELADNFELYPIDVVVDGGLSTVYAGSSGTGGIAPTHRRGSHRRAELCLRFAAGSGRRARSGGSPRGCAEQETFRP